MCVVYIFFFFQEEEAFEVVRSLVGLEIFSKGRNRMNPNNCGIVMEPTLTLSGCCAVFSFLVYQGIAKKNAKLDNRHKLREQSLRAPRSSLL